MAEQLEVGIGLRDRLTAGLQRSLGRIRQFSSAATAAFSRLRAAIFNVRTLLAGLAVAFVGRGISDFVKGVADADDHLSKLSTRLGLSTEFLSEFRFVAERSGVPLSALDTGLQRLTRRLSEFQRTGGKGVAAQGFATLGLTEFALQAKGVEEILPKIADAVKAIGDSGAAVEAVASLVDTEGVSFVQFLKEGSDGIQALRDEARELGVTLSGDVASGAASFNDQLSNLGRLVTSLKQEFVRSLYDDLAESLKTLIQQIKDNREELLAYIDAIRKFVRDVAPLFIEGVGLVTFQLKALSTVVVGLQLSLNGLEIGFIRLARVLVEALSKLSDPKVAGVLGVLGAANGVKGLGEQFENLGKLVDGASDALGRMEDQARDTRKELLETLDSIFSGRRAGGSGSAGGLPTGGGSAAGGPSLLDSGGSIAAALGASPDTTRTTMEILIDDANRARESIDQLTVAARNRAIAAFRDLGNVIQSNVVNAIGALVDGTKKASEAFKDMARSILADLARLATNQVLTSILGAVFGGITGSLFGPGFTQGATQGVVTGLQGVGGQLQAPGYASGGVFNRREGLALLHGPEAVVPLPDGRAIPVRMEGAAGGVSQTNVFNIQATDAASFDAQWQASFAKNLNQATDAVLARYATDRRYRSSFG